MQFIERRKKICLFRPCLAQSMKKKKVFSFFLKKMFLSKCCLGLTKCKLSNSADVFYAKVRKVCFNVRNWTKNFTKFPNSVCRQKNVSMDTWKAIMRTPPQNIWPKTPEKSRNKNFRRSSSGHLICRWKNAGKTFALVWTFFARSLKNKKEFF